MEMSEKLDEVCQYRENAFCDDVLSQHRSCVKNDQSISASQLSLG